MKNWNNAAFTLSQAGTCTILSEVDLLGNAWSSIQAPTSFHVREHEMLLLQRPRCGRYGLQDIRGCCSHVTSDGTNGTSGDSTQVLLRHRDGMS